MASEADYMRVEDGDIVLQGATENTTITDSPATYASLGCPRGDVTITDGFEVKTIQASNWCTVTQAAGELLQKRRGNREVSMSFALDAVLSDAQTKAALAAYKAGDQYFIKQTMTDNNSTPNSLVDEFRGEFNRFNRVAEQDGIARFDVEYFVKEILQDAVVAP